MVLWSIFTCLCSVCHCSLLLRRVWRYQRCNQNPSIEEEQTTQLPKEKVQKDKQRSTKHTHKTKDRVTRTQLKTWGELRLAIVLSVLQCTDSDYSFSIFLPFLHSVFKDNCKVLCPLFWPSYYLSWLTASG